jgi:hypothetical protein
MDEYTKSQIPDNWQEMIEPSEFDGEINQVTSDLIALAGSQLNLENPSQEEIIEVCSKIWKTTTAEVKNSWRSIVRIRATTRLFTRYYGHLFPKDDNGELILHPDDITRIYRKR